LGRLLLLVSHPWGFRRHDGRVDSVHERVALGAVVDLDGFAGAGAAASAATLGTAALVAGAYAAAGSASAKSRVETAKRRSKIRDRIHHLLFMKPPITTPR